MNIVIASYNTRHGADADFDMSKMASVIKKIDADIVGFQEVDINSIRTGGLDMLAELKKETGYKYAEFIKCVDLPGGDYGNAVLSRYPILSAEKLPLECPEGTEPRMVGILEIDVNGNVFTYANTHLSLGGDRVVSKQIAYIASKLVGRDRYFLTGDFNTQTLSLFEVFTDGDRLMKDGRRLVTFPENNQTIDNIVFGGNNAATLIDFGTEENSYSDHFVLWGKFAL